MRKIKLFFDRLDYILMRLFHVMLMIIGVVALIIQHWPWRQ